MDKNSCEIFRLNSCFYLVSPKIYYFPRPLCPRLQPQQPTAPITAICRNQPVSSANALYIRCGAAANKSFHVPTGCLSSIQRFWNAVLQRKHDNPQQHSDHPTYRRRTAQDHLFNYVNVSPHWLIILKNYSLTETFQ